MKLVLSPKGVIYKLAMEQSAKIKRKLLERRSARMNIHEFVRKYNLTVELLHNPRPDGSDYWEARIKGTPDSSIKATFKKDTYILEEMFDYVYRRLAEAITNSTLNSGLIVPKLDI